MIESLTLAFVLGAFPAAEPVAVPSPAPQAQKKHMTPDERRKRVARIEAAKKKQKMKERREAAQRKAAAQKRSGQKRGAAAGNGAKQQRQDRSRVRGQKRTDKPYTHPSGMRIGTFKPGHARTQLGPQVNKASKGKDGVRRKAEAKKQPRKRNG
ncbi:MAG: hypothetical protein ACF8XB_06680 [Planctomycetota bacterium JB042]